MAKNIVKIGKIVQSQSHIVYICRVFGTNETTNSISEKDYQFGQFVKINPNNGLEFYGIIFNSQLYNPEYGNFGPRLTSPSDLNQVFTPDYIDETAVLLNIIIIGWKDSSGFKQGIPPAVVTLNAEVCTLKDEEIKNIHFDNNNQISLAYYSTILDHTGNFSTHLLLKIINNLKLIVNNTCIEELSLLEQHIKWQQTSLATRV